MTQKDKELLLKDLCVRLPYGIIIKHKDEHGKSIDARLVGYNGDWFNYYIDDLCFHLKIYEFKPYLRPMSSMTEEEKIEFQEILGKAIMSDTPVASYQGVDWLNAHHFDFRNLIGKGLALEAPKGIYNLNKE